MSPLLKNKHQCPIFKCKKEHAELTPKNVIHADQALGEISVCRVAGTRLAECIYPQGCARKILRKRDTSERCKSGSQRMSKRNE